MKNIPGLIRFTLTRPVSINDIKCPKGYELGWLVVYRAQEIFNTLVTASLNKRLIIEDDGSLKSIRDGSALAECCAVEATPCIQSIATLVRMFANHTCDDGTIEILGNVIPGLSTMPFEIPILFTLTGERDSAFDVLVCSEVGAPQFRLRSRHLLRHTQMEKTA